MYIQYSMDQLCLPMELEEDIPQNHLVRIVNAAVNRLDDAIFMWIADRQRPDFRTINRFRSERMKDVLEKMFTAILQFLVEAGYVKLEHYFVDGTKIEANANKFTMKSALGKLPGTVIADTGYGGEENYAYLEKEQVKAVVKYSTYHKEKSKKWKNGHQQGRKLVV